MFGGVSSHLHFPLSEISTLIKIWSESSGRPIVLSNLSNYGRLCQWKINHTTPLFSLAADSRELNASSGRKPYTVPLLTQYYLVQRNIVSRPAC